MSRLPSRPHLPMRPAWLCRSCAAPWPCSTAQLCLVTEFHGHSTALAFYLAASMYEAMDDMYRLGARPAPGVLHARFLGWLSRARCPAPDRSCPRCRGGGRPPSNPV
ncbi:hypothetical protein [Micromonospora rubida]|uniref:hypothetical protein n=1 Tax=Micromonospora rubida TaxID=2697657 RepID=UPI00191C0467|nr:hypothetical protein [Micromonospora rubida]